MDHDVCIARLVASMFVFCDLFVRSFTFERAQHISNELVLLPLSAQRGCFSNGYIVFVRPREAEQRDRRGDNNNLWTSKIYPSLSLPDHIAVGGCVPVCGRPN